LSKIMKGSCLEYVGRDSEVGTQPLLYILMKQIYIRLILVRSHTSSSFKLISLYYIIYQNNVCVHTHTHASPTVAVVLLSKDLKEAIPSFKFWYVKWGEFNRQLTIGWWWKWWSSMVGQLLDKNDLTAHLFRHQEIFCSSLYFF